MINVVVLGSGDTILKILKKLNKDKEFSIKAIGTNKIPDNEIISFAKINQITIVESLDNLKEIDFDFVYMLSYAPLIEKHFLDKYLFINTHYAPLPRYRGFHGFVWCIINGESEAGFTIHKVEDGIDNGAIYYQYKKEIKEQDDVNSLIKFFEENLVENIKDILLKIYEGQIPKIQNENEAIYVARRRLEDNLISWNQSSRDIHNFIRALTPPYTEGAFTSFNNEKVNIIETELLNTPAYTERPGKIVNIDKNEIWVKTKDSVLLVKKISSNGKFYNHNELEIKIGQVFK